MSQKHNDALELGLDFTPRFGPDGTLPAVATDAESGEVVMLAYMNSDALKQTIETGVATYWSRSRQSLWVKGETSGNRQIVKSMRTDCDQDAVWISVHVEGHGASCHRGYHSCFYRAVPTAEIGRGADAKTDTLEMDADAPAFDPSKIYGS